jgi:hypothetical protein
MAAVSGLGAGRFWIALSYGDGPEEAPAQWVVSVAPDRNMWGKPESFPRPRCRRNVQK